MAHGSADYYNPDAQLAASLTKLDTAVARLDTTITKLDSVLSSIGENIGSLSSDMKTLLTTIRSQAMGDATSLHASGTGTVGTSAVQKIAAWTGRTGFSVTQTGTGAGVLYVGGSNKCAMASLHAGGSYVNETYCGAIYLKGSGTAIPYAFEEW